MKDRQAYGISLSLHFFVLACVAIMTFLGGCKEEIHPDHVFEMVSLSVPTSTAQQPTPQPQQTPEPSPRLKQPDFAPVPNPPAEPVQQPQPQPKAKPTPAPKPKPQPEPKPKPRLQTTSYADFANEHKLPEDKAPAPKPRPRVDLPDFNTDKMKNALARDIESVKLNLPANSNLTAAQQEALASFGNQLRAHLEKRWKKPGIFAQAILTVNVSPDGSLSARLKKSSGDTLFDRSVLNAVKAVGKMPPPPGGKSASFDIPFTMTEG